MKYLIQIYNNEQATQTWENMTEEERQEGLRQYAALHEEIAKRGELIATGALADPSQAKVVTTRDGKITTTDGPFAEAKEHMAGFFLVECADVDQAVEIAAKIPEASGGLVEVRLVEG